MIADHIFFRLETEQEVMEFLSLGGMALLDPARKGESINTEMVSFLTHRGILIVDLILWRLA